MKGQRVSGRRTDFVQHLQSWRPRWRMLAPLLIVFPVTGAAVGAAVHPPPVNHDRAEVSVIPGGVSVAQRQATAALMAGMADLPSVVDGAVNSTFRQGSRVVSRIHGPGILTLVVTGQTQPIALTVANALAEHITSLGEDTIDRANRLAGVAIGNPGLGGEEPWTGPSQFVLKAQQVLAEPAGRLGRPSLKVRCTRGPGCGVTSVLTYEFRRGVRYTATALVRDSPGSSASPAVRMLFGSNPGDVVTGKFIVAGQRWREMSVSWSPNIHSTDTVEIGAQSNDKSATFLLSEVIMSDPTGLSDSPVSGMLTATQRAFAIREAATATIVPARAIGEATGSTLKWGLLGLLAGALIAIAAFVGGSLADRRRREHQG